MPTVQPPALRARNFPSRRKAKRGAGDAPPRARQLIALMALGPADGSGPLSLPDAAKEMGITVDTASRYFGHPKARAEYLRLIRDIREGEYARNTSAAVEIRDDPRLKLSAAGAKARIESIRFIENKPDEYRYAGGPGVTVSPGVVVTVNVNREPAQVDDTIILVGSADGALHADS